MVWKSNQSKSGEDYIGNAETASEAAKEMWPKFITDVLPKNLGIAWDHIRVELWLDSGRIIFFPAATPFRRRIEKSACQIGCRDTLEFYEKLIAANLPDSDFEQKLASKEKEIVEMISSTAREAGLHKLPGRSEV